jgi:hypothetical protein
MADAKSCEKARACPDLDEVVFKLTPPKDNTPVTLSWFITGAGRKEIADQLLQSANQINFAKIDALLGR